MRYHSNTAEQIDVRSCDVEGCIAEGCHPAPKERRLEDSPTPPAAHFWFCLQHAREYNKSWNFFKGMSSAEIERFQVEALTGHRRTRRLQDQLPKPSKKIFLFRSWNETLFGPTPGVKPQASKAPALSRDEREAFSLLSLKPSATFAEIRSRYRELVKRYHPDMAGGSEEMFKRISRAYRLLIRRANPQT